MIDVIEKIILFLSLKKLLNLNLRLIASEEIKNITEKKGKDANDTSPKLKNKVPNLNNLFLFIIYIYYLRTNF